MSGTRNQLLGDWFQPPGDASVNPLARKPTYADAAEWHGQNLADTWAAVKDPQTWVDASRQYGNALLMGSIAPGARSAHVLDLDKLTLPRHLTDVERQAVATYASSSPWINGPAPDAEPVRKALESAISKSELGSDAVLYRGFGADPAILEQLQVGKVVPLSGGNVSTTTSREVAQGFADDLYSGDRSVMVVIRTPKGTKALAVPTAPEFQRDPDNPASQSEILLSRDQRFKITGRRELGGDRVEITATPVGPDEP